MTKWEAEIFNVALEKGMFKDSDRMLAGLEEPKLVDVREISDIANKLCSLICSTLESNYKSDLCAMALAIGFRPETAKLMRYFSEEITSRVFFGWMYLLWSVVGNF